MKYAISAVMTIACAVLGAAAANAVVFTATTDAPLTLSPGDTFTVTVEMDALDLTTETTLGFAFSVAIDPLAFAVVGGTQSPLVFQASVGTILIGGIPLVSPNPPNNDVDPATIRMGVWGVAVPLDPASFGLAWGDEIVATVTLEVLPGVEGDFDIDPFFAQGDSINLDGVNETDAIFFGETVTVPEPGAGLLSFAALASVLGIVRGRRER